LEKGKKNSGKKNLVHEIMEMLGAAGGTTKKEAQRGRFKKR